MLLMLPCLLQWYILLYLLLLLYIFSRFVKEISVKTGIQPLILSEFSLSLSLSLSHTHTHTRTHVSVGYWFEWLTCQEFEEPSSMLERCNDELKKVYVGYKQHALYLSIFLYSRPQAGR